MHKRLSGLGEGFIYGYVLNVVKLVSSYLWFYSNRPAQTEQYRRNFYIYTTVINVIYGTEKWLKNCRVSI